MSENNKALDIEAFSNSSNKKVLEDLYSRYGIDIEVLKEYDELSGKQKTSLIRTMLNSNNIPKEKLTKITSDMYGLETETISSIKFEEIPQQFTDEELLDQHDAAPVYVKGGNLFIAVNDPNDSGPLSSYQFSTGMSTQAVLMSQSHIKKLKDLNKKKITSEHLSSIDFNNPAANMADNDDYDPNNNPLVEYIDKIIEQAVKEDASDMHFEPYKDAYRIRFRSDGMLHEIASLPIGVASPVSSRLKVLSNLDISEKRIPQDGRFNMLIEEDKSYDFRVSTCPTLYGEKIVIRILDPYKAKLGIDELGYEPEQKQTFVTALQKLQGIILVTGPTGSGKTISLYTALNALNTEDRNISTAEDPIEIYLPGVTQVQMNAKIGLDFSSALRCFLRQDPDVMMVGEIRDFETAEIAIKAAQTGHLVLSTLHTNSAAETLNRLINMGLPSYNLATTISMVIAQRLIKRLCPHCKIEETIPYKVLIDEYFPADLISEDTMLFTSNKDGCDNCKNGFKGRIGIYETLAISKEMEQVILHSCNTLDIKKQAKKENVLSLRQSGLRKVLKGITSLTEVNRVTKNA